MLFMAPTLWILAAALAAPAADVEFFERKIRPVLAEKCYPCHNAKALMGACRSTPRPGF